MKPPSVDKQFNLEQRRNKKPHLCKVCPQFLFELLNHCTHV